MSSILFISLWRMYVYVFLMHTTIMGVVAFQKFDKRNCALFVPLDEKLSTYLQYDSIPNKGKPNSL